MFIRSWTPNVEHQKFLNPPNNNSYNLKISNFSLSFSSLSWSRNNDVSLSIFILLLFEELFNTGTLLASSFSASLIVCRLLLSASLWFRFCNSPLFLLGVVRLRFIFILDKSHEKDCRFLSVLVLFSIFWSFSIKIKSIIYSVYDV